MTTFTGFCEGALKVWSIGIVTLKDALLAESSLFKELKVDESIIQSNNRWVLSDSGTCSIFGSLNLEMLLLFTPMVQSVIIKESEKKTGIDVDIKGSSLFRFERLFLLFRLKQKVSMNEDKITSKKNELGNVILQWESDTIISASISEDEFVNKGKKLTISNEVLTDEGLIQEVQQQAKEPHCPMELKLKNNGKTIVDIINRNKK
ncbi:MAG: hypothetical protein EZS28_033249 [Streblomastix strix]|uniref:Uncharacterized protein n=1 Tax=Streblomastix strix TaxID=222440 RepID=A0A5J4ULW6_9EUKA|nr:MAG: hypothetical protein EZS28_033249 [Streblomastix strix]